MPICADDYSITNEISKRILGLIENEQLCSTSVMVLFKEIHYSAELGRLSKKANIGLHFTLTDFEPQSEILAKLVNGKLPSFREWMFRRDFYTNKNFSLAIEDELNVQIKKFEDAFGFSPDHIDCHHHLQFLPPIHKIISKLYPSIKIRPTRTKIHLGADTFKMSMRKIILNRLSPVSNDTILLLEDKFSLENAVKYFDTVINEYDGNDMLLFHPGSDDEALRSKDSLNWQRERDFRLLSDPELNQRLFRRFLRFKA
jgi:predicted glycoside hydrolase/deacetylase ChbG (UPF0249 family)